MHLLIPVRETVQVVITNLEGHACHQVHLHVTLSLMTEVPVRAAIIPQAIVALLLQTIHVTHFLMLVVHVQVVTTNRAIVVYRISDSKNNLPIDFLPK